MRSELGQGERVAIFTLGNEWIGKGYDNRSTPYDECPKWDICGPGEGEDYAKCKWPIVVKTKPGVTVRQLKQALLDLIVCLREKTPDELVSDKLLPGPGKCQQEPEGPFST